MLYSGRREGAKGWDRTCSPTSPPRSGTRTCRSHWSPWAPAPIDAPPEIADRVIDVGFLPNDERDNAFAAADAYLQPVGCEAFSRTIMEAWLAGTPVIANSASEVVRWHCARSGAGLTYDDQHEFEQCLAFVS